MLKKKKEPRQTNKKIAKAKVVAVWLK
jgi:hypothetical protein